MPLCVEKHFFTPRCSNAIGGLFVDTLKYQNEIGINIEPSETLEKFGTINRVKGTCQVQTNERPPSRAGIGAPCVIL